MNTKSAMMKVVPVKSGKGALPEYTYQSRALEVITRTIAAATRPAVLDLGPARSSTVDFFGQFSASLFVADVREALLSSMPRTPDESALLAESMRTQRCIDALPAQGTFDLLLCWDLCNYLSEPELRAILPLLNSLCRAGTLLLVLLSDNSTALPGPLHCSLKGSEQVSLIPEVSGLSAPALCHESTIKKHFPGAQLESAVRLRNGICELLFVLGQEPAPKRPSKKFERP